MRKSVILISGKLQSGKNTFADILKEELESRGHTVAIDYFAKLLKDMCKDAFRPLTDYLNQTLESILVQPYDFYKDDLHDLITNDENWYEKKNPITRHILQIVGTEIVRTVNEHFWIDSFVKRMRERPERITICSDVRFENEISRVEVGCTTWKLRVERSIQRTESFNEHVSETALDNYAHWDHVIYNEGTIEDLKAKAKEIVDKMYLDIQVS